MNKTELTAVVTTYKLKANMLDLHVKADGFKRRVCMNNMQYQFLFSKYQCAIRGVWTREYLVQTISANHEEVFEIFLEMLNAELR